MPKINQRHGGPWDRGSADSWYRRPRNPHYFIGGTYDSEPIKEADMTADEITEYHAGYDENEESGGHKDYGDDE